ncbi:hypothetical protein PFFVO_01909 [Plasmodium falciparum Vietnam Oak-Knoll (FVO)]|uniref:Surface antigen n=1 Tax=Plasmodium falciparum Vietnam Oak-Knoll (FVO) TaxID=1036723 RepID=A0A024VA41_PLAFA|nr:hypothetical protein PFFVO_01909 [Plasmodium falciparum Vietnam Oak-Knoll (FVO)]
MRVYNQRNYYITPRHTETNRSLCECELYSPTNYDSDPEMKRVMQQFVDRTTQRFHEYDERMKTTRQKYREQCNKEIQKIILKDKIEKELAEKLAALETNIDINDIPTCICEKSLADKVEKGCLMCGCGLGGVAAGVGIIGPVAVKGLENAAMLVAAQKGIEAGMEAAIQGVKKIYYLGEVESVNFGEVVTATNFSDQNLLGQALQTLANDICGEGGAGCDKSFCLLADGKNAARFAEGIAQQARAVAIKAGDAAKTAEKVGISLANTESSSSYLAIGYSVLAILIILLIMIIIYLILRYRRKKKMQKKLQYIKLLKE